MTFLPLTLGITPVTGTDGKPIKMPTKAEQDQILKHDKFTCRFCGFRAVQFQRVVPVGDGFATACGFCEQAVTLERTGLAGNGYLVWLPEITQAELSHVMRAVYIARSFETGPLADAATRALDALMSRRAEAKKRLGSDDPLLLATVLEENVKSADRASVAAKIEGIRFLPLDKHTVHGRHGDFNGFPQILQFWRSEEGPFAHLPAEQWQALFDKVAA